MKPSKTETTTEPQTRFILVNSPEELARHRDRWDELLEKVPGSLPTGSFAWLSSYFKHRVNDGESWRCLFAYSGENLVAVWPAVGRTIRSVLKSYNSLRMPSDLHTISVQPTLAPGLEKELIPQILSCLEESGPKGTTHELTRIPGDSPLVASLEGNVGKRLCSVGFDDFGSFLSTTGDYDAYFGELSSGFRRNLRKSNNRLGKNHSLEFQVIQPQTHDEEIFRRFLHVEEQNLKGDAGSAISCNPRLVSFYRDAISNFAGSDRLEWQVLRIDDEDAAMFLAISTGRAKVLFKIGYDEKFARLMPGSLLMERVLQDAFNSPNVDEINLISSADWHMRWNPQQRRHVNIRIFPRTVDSFLFLYLPRSARSLAKAQVERRMERKI